MLPIFAPLISLLVSEGLDMAAGAIKGAGAKGKEFIEEKIGVKIDEKADKLPADVVDRIKKLEADPVDSLELKKLALEDKKEDNRHDEANRNKAHETYQVKSSMADTIAQQIISRNLPIIGLLVVINVALVYFLQDKASLIAIASNIIGVAIGNLFNERQAIVNFFFGSSLSSKDKDDHIKTLTKGK